tara:strand:- start:1710 stop:2534 length:825 start_codon:yes stop_codon:yes gene_type:complete
MNSKIKYIDKFRLDSKLVFVAGGLGLIGNDVVQTLAEAGGKIVILDINNQEGKKFVEKINKDFQSYYEFFDCSEINEIDKNLNLLIDKYGCPDVFVNCSWPRTKDYAESNFEDLKLDSLRKNVDIHMNSYAWLAISLAEAMAKKNKKGSIIQFGSTYGLVGQDLSIYKGTSMKENASYALIKGGIVNLTRLMCSYYGQHSIRVNTICPGGIKGHVAGSSDSQEVTFVENYENKVPLKRLGESYEIGPPTLFLASDASSYVTGITLVVDGGWTAI